MQKFGDMATLRLKPAVGIWSGVSEHVGSSTYTAFTRVSSDISFKSEIPAALPVLTHIPLYNGIRYLLPFEIIGRLLGHF